VSSLAILAAQGAAILLRRFPSKALAAVLIVFPLVESFDGPAPYTTAPEVPPIYRWLSEIPGPVPVFELPLPPVKRQRDNAVYLYWSTTHFKPLANGYATLVPPVYAEIADAMPRFPDAAGVALLKRLGFRYVILHRDRYLRARAAGMEQRMSAAPGLRRVFRTANETVYEVL